MVLCYILIALCLLIVLKRVVKIVPADSICIIEKKQHYYKTLRPGWHCITPFYSQARIVPVEKRNSIPVTKEITFGDSSRHAVTVSTTFLLWDPYTPFFTFEKLDTSMSNQALKELETIASTCSMQEFTHTIDSIKQKCLDALNQFGKEYGIEFTQITIAL